ncbi:MAG: phosphoglucomutase/phosphomannomutase family protein [Desulfuromonadaceae bacterium]|nr:phosphoglucomutase/phosphomannomutase family protein [Desulfuromonadaceae bacterium]
MQRNIIFGTSGWRGLLADDFTFGKVRIVTRAIADHLLAQGTADGGVIVGCDARFLGKNFVAAAAQILAAAGIKAFVCDRDTPTPVIAHEIIRRGCSGAINFTASHNPYEYNGLKFSPASGGPALPGTTADIERRANEMSVVDNVDQMTVEQARSHGLYEEIDPRPAYVESIRKLVNFDAILSSGLIFAINPLYGTAIGYLDKLLGDAGVTVMTINDHRDPYFGGYPPEPAQANIAQFIDLIRNDSRLSLGLATDGDADRYGIVDSDGTYIEPNYILALLADYMLRSGRRGDLARSVATSHLLDRVAAHHGVNILETPVGFKFIGEYIAAGKILIGGEESAGLTISGHVPDKDGILACLLVAEMVAVEQKTIAELLTDLYRRVGEVHTRRINLRLTPELETSFAEKMSVTPDEFGGKKVCETNTVDGYKFILDDGSWLLFRKSGTEPVVRLYGEANCEEHLQAIIDAGRSFVLGLP